MQRNQLLRKGTLIAVIILGLAAGFYLLFISPSISRDFQTYYYSAVNMLHGSPFVGSDASMPTGPYVYLPVTVVIYLPLAFLNESLAYIILLIFNIIGALSAGILLLSVLRTQSVDLDEGDMVLIVGTIVLSPPSVANLLQGQPNFWLLVALIAGYSAIERGNQYYAGVLLAIPAIIKLWPAGVGVWLVYRRAWKATITAIITGLTAIFASIVVFGINMNIRYFEYIITERSWTAQFMGGLDPNTPVVTIRRPISVLLPNLNPSIMAFIGILLMGSILMLFYSKKSNDPLISLTATIACLILAFPSVRPYIIFLYFPAIVLLYELQATHLQAILSIGIILISSILTPSDFSALVVLVPLPSAIEEILIVAIETVLQFGSVPLYGITILLSVSYVSDVNSRLSAVD